MYDFSAKFRSIFRILSVYLMSLLMFSGNSYGMESDPNQDYGSLGNSNLNHYNANNFNIALNFDNKSKSVKRPWSIGIFGEDKDEIQKVAHLLRLNNSNKPLGINVPHYHEFVPHSPDNNLNLKFEVIPYEHGNLQKTIVNQFGKESFDCFDLIIHVSNKDTLTADRIKHFYDKLNYAWLGKDYDENVYAPFGELRLRFWNMAKQIKNYKTNIPRTLFFIFNGTRDELYNLDSFDEVKNYISAMPDSRSIYTLKLDDVNVRFDELIDAMLEASDGMPEFISLKRIDELKKKLKLVGENQEKVVRQRTCLDKIKDFFSAINPLKFCVNPESE